MSKKTYGTYRIQAQGAKAQLTGGPYSNHKRNLIISSIFDGVVKYDLYGHNRLEQIIFQVVLVKFVKI